MACRVDKFPPSACLPVSTSKTCETCVYVCGHYVGLRCVCVCVCYWPGHRVDLQGKSHHPSTPRMSLSPWLHAPVLPPVSLPLLHSMFVPEVHTPACLKPSHSPGALSSVGGNTLNYFHMMEWNVTLQMGSHQVYFGKNCCDIAMQTPL